MPVRGVKQRTVVALLALHRVKPVSADRLIEALWGDRQVANAANALRPSGTAVLRLPPLCARRAGQN